MRIDCYHCKAIIDGPDNAVSIFCPQSAVERLNLGRVLGLTRTEMVADPENPDGPKIATTVDAPLPEGLHVYELRGYSIVAEEHTTRPEQRVESFAAAKRVTAALLLAFAFASSGCALNWSRVADGEKACASDKAAAAIAAAVMVANEDLKKGEPWLHVVIDVAEAAGPYERCAFTALLASVESGDTP